MNALAQRKEELAAAIRSWHHKGWSPATSTNYSFRLEEDPGTIYVSRSGIDKSQFFAADFMEVDLQGKAKEGFEHLRPSAETLIHCTLYMLFPETQCIVHSHSVYSVLHSAVQETAIPFEGYEVLKGYDGIQTHETAVDLPVFDNTQDMVAFSETLVREKARLTIPAFVMRKHGTYAWGINLFEAKRHLEVTEYLLECEWKLASR
jgi:methylthioribulose-1-phosphate dehydratase